MATARAIWSGAISFGLVNIPVKLYTATERRDISFTSLHATDKSPLRRPYTCPVDNVPVGGKDIAKGYEYAKNAFVVITDEELDSVRVESSQHITVETFVDPNEINPLYYENSYYLGPTEASVKPWELFRQVLVRTSKVAIGQATLWRKEHLVALRPIGNGLVLSLLNYADEVKPPPDLPVTKPIVISDAELALAENLIDALSGEFNPAMYRDRYREALMAMIEAKIDGKIIEVAPQVEVQATQDLMAALKASLQATKRA